jgi:SsrA-binding protein
MIVNNRKAYYEFHIHEEFEAGVVLVGSEVKSIRMGNVTIADSFIYLKDNEVWLKNMNVARYKSSHPLTKHEENRDKKLLLSRKEINRIERKLQDKGTTAIPLTIFIKRNRIKIKIGLATGKKLYDKRNSIKEKDLKRDQQRNIA